MKRFPWKPFTTCLVLAVLAFGLAPAQDDPDKVPPKVKERPPMRPSVMRPAGSPTPIPFGPGAPAPGITPSPDSPQGPEPAPSPSPRPSRPVSDGLSRSSSGAGFNLQIYDADLFDFIDLICKQLEMDYLIDAKVQANKVNISIKKPVPREALMPILIDILRINGATIVKSGEIYHFVPIQEGKKYPSEIKRIKGREDVVGEELNTYIIPVQFMPAGELARILDEFKTDNTQIINLETYNILMISDFGDNLKKLLDIVEILDNGFFEVNMLELVPIQFNKAEDVTKDLTVVFSAGSNSTGIKFIAVPRLNSVLVVCRTPNAMDQVKKWIEKLDAPAARGVETFVYKVENTTATNIADILGQLFEDMGAQTGAVGPRQKTVATGEASTTASGQPSVPMGGQVIQPELKGTTKGGEGVAIQGLSGNVKIICDDLNNSLIIQGTQADYEFLLKTIKKLDVLPRQVLVEAKIIAVQLQGTLTYGVGAWLKGRGDADGNDIYPPTQGQFTPSDATKPGLTISTLFTFGLNGQRQVDLLLNTLESITKVQVLDSPALLVLDGNQATFNVGDEIPIATSSFTNPYLGGTTPDNNQYNITNTQIQYRSTGVSLNVAPRISAAGVVTMEIATEVSTPGEASKGLAGSPPISRAALNTTMVVQDGASVVLAGIIRERDGTSVAGLPGLSRIPVLGWLFGDSSKSKTRNELLVILTPHVIHTSEDLIKTSDAVQHSLKNINNFIRNKKKHREYGVYQPPEEKKKKDKKKDEAKKKKKEDGKKEEAKDGAGDETAAVAPPEPRPSADTNPDKEKPKDPEKIDIPEPAADPAKKPEPEPEPPKSSARTLPPESLAGPPPPGA
ncbi:MAG: type II secretion system secretin GspD [Acidobacteria bacterium]|nr:type II secretion system secretin GspD [Acidobacteriota bacterium]